MDFRYAAALAVVLLIQGSIGQDDEGKTLDFQVAITISDKTLQKNIGDGLVLTCKVVSQTTETPTLTWMVNGEPITAQDQSERVYVDVSDSSVRLRVAKIEDKDSGNYECVGKLGDQEDSKAITLEIIKPLTINSPENQFGVKGTDGEVMCDVTAKPAPTITWKLLNNTQIKNSDKYIIQVDKLIIKNLDFDDDMTYVCDIIVESTGDAKKLTIDYQVVELPKIQHKPTHEPNNPKVGDEVKITCIATGVPAPTYTFTKDGNSIPEDQIDAKSGILTIEKLASTDEANYNCIATNDGGSDEEETFLDVQIPPTIQEMNDIGEAVEGGIQNIQCITEGDPAPSVLWKKKGSEGQFLEDSGHPFVVIDDVNDDKAAIKKVTATLTFDTVTAQDAATYECVATNLVGTAKDELTMDVQFKPHFDVPFKQDIFYGWKGHRANLTCQAAGNGLPVIKWKRKMTPDADAVDIANNDPFTLNDITRDEKNHLSSRILYVFIDTDQSFYGEYICEASNSRGDITKKVTLIEAFAPQAPVATVTNAMSTVVDFTFTKPTDDGGQSVKSFKYTYNEDVTGAEPVDATVDASGDDAFVTIEDLKAATSYVIKVQAVNAVGPGTAVEVAFQTLAVSKPEKLEMSSNPIGSEATSYTLRWAKPNDGGSPITKYTIRYKQVEVTPNDDPALWKVTSDVDTEFKEVTEADGNAQSYQLKNLKRDSYYEIRFTATNEKGTSNEEVRHIKTIRGSGAASASAGLGSGVMIAIIVAVIFILLIVIIVIVIVVKKKRSGVAGDAESGKKDDRKTAAEQEKLIQENTKVENENDKGEGIEAKQEYEPDQKPEQPTAQSADSQAKGGEVPSEPTIQITPDTPEKADNPSA